MKSVFNDIEIPTYPALRENIQTDILIIGGGIAGYLCAYEISKTNPNVVLVEANELFHSTTSLTTAYITPHQGFIYHEIAKIRNKDIAKNYYDSQMDALKYYKKTVDELEINCNFTKVNSVTFCTTYDERLKKEKDFLESIDIHSQIIQELEFPLSIHNALLYKDEVYHFNPIKFLLALPVHFLIYTNSRIIKIDQKNKICFTKEYQIQANKIIIATKYPLINVPNLFFTKLYQSKSYASSFLSSKILNTQYLDAKENGLTFRSYQNHIIIGGLDHRTGEQGNLGKMNEVQHLKQAGSRYFNSSVFEDFWCSEDCCSFDSIPFIGPLFKNNFDLFMIGAFNKWGMANAMIGSKIINDYINNRNNPYFDTFLPHRPYIMNNILPYAKNSIKVIGHFTSILFQVSLLKNLKVGEGKIIFLKGKKKAVYKDFNDKLHIINGLCPHLKCQMRFDLQSKNWECPCHGTRLDIDGRIIDSPAKKEGSYEVFPRSQKP